jgi:hypothetical protein
VSRGAFAASGIALFIFLLSWANYGWGHWEPVFVMGALVVVWLETAFADGSSMSAMGSKRRLSTKSLLAVIVVSLLTTFIIWITALIGTGRVT